MRLLPVLGFLLAACDFDAGIGGLDDLVDLSVNRANATPVDDEEGGLQLRAESGDNEPGGFHGAGTGNKAIAGLPGYDGMPLFLLGGAAFEARALVEGSTPYFNLVVDLDCGTDTLSLIVADSTVVPAPEEVSPEVWRYEFLAEEAQWKAVGGLGDILPGHLEGEGGRLTEVLDAWPHACLADADTGDAGMPADTVTTAVMLILGDSLNEQELEQRVSAVEIGGSRYE